MNILIQLVIILIMLTLIAITLWLSINIGGVVASLKHKGSQDKNDWVDASIFSPPDDSRLLVALDNGIVFIGRYWIIDGKWTIFFADGEREPEEGEIAYWKQIPKSPQG